MASMISYGLKLQQGLLGKKLIEKTHQCYLVYQFYLFRCHSGKKNTYLLISDLVYVKIVQFVMLRFLLIYSEF